MNAVRDPTDDPQWDTIGVAACDFRPHFNGDMVNVWSCVSPEPTAAATALMLEQRTRIIAQWILDHREEFGEEDQFQIILGWPESLRDTSRQKVKMSGGISLIAEIADGNSPVYTRWESDPLMGTQPETEPEDGG